MLTAQQLKQRRPYITSTDMIAILGRDYRWGRTGLDVFYEKTGRLELARPGDESAQAGDNLESGILKQAEQYFGPIETRDKKGNPFFAIDPIGGILASTLDGRIILSKESIEAKSRGLFNREALEGWGEPYTDDVPQDTIVQVSVQAVCCQKEQGHILALLAGRGFQPYTLRLLEGMADELREVAYKFQQRIKSDTPPDDSFCSMDTIKRIIREPKSIKPAMLDAEGKIVFTDIDPLVVEYEEWKEKESATKAGKEAAQAKLLTHLGTFEAAKYSQGMITYPQQVSRRAVICPACQHHLSEETYCHKLYLKTDKKK